MSTIKQFEVCSTKSGHIFGIFEAETPEAAIEACNLAAGYESTGHANEVVGCENGLIATEVA